ncbi:YqaE/Pmp3 family membrane protein [Sphingomonas sp. DBB INV C78]|uniref:YqaE/Pmp3 family membrane protein n=1 Tax=Sphingomonas sp. DBB INV C78 TaxID=3349434 RepID=UPI0036D28D8D
MPVVAAIAALFLPPLGVFLDRGITPAFWICVGLTLLFFVPGVIYALATILAPRLARS